MNAGADSNVVLFGADPATWAERHATIHAEYSDLCQEFRQVLIAHSVPIHQHSTWCRYGSAERRYHEFWMRRAKAIAKALNRVLASDYVPEEERPMLERALHGAVPHGRETRLLTDVEQELLTAFRACVPEERNMLKALLPLLAKKGQQAQAREDGLR